MNDDLVSQSNRPILFNLEDKGGMKDDCDM